MTITDEERARSFIGAISRGDESAALGVAFDDAVSDHPNSANGFRLQVNSRIAVDEPTELRVSIEFSTTASGANVSAVEVAWPVGVHNDLGDVKRTLWSARSLVGAAASHDIFHVYALSVIADPARGGGLQVRRPSGEAFASQTEGMAFLDTLAALSATPQGDWIRTVDRLHMELVAAATGSEGDTADEGSGDPTLRNVALGARAALLEALDRW